MTNPSVFVSALTPRSSHSLLTTRLLRPPSRPSPQASSAPSPSARGDLEDDSSSASSDSSDDVTVLSVRSGTASLRTAAAVAGLHAGAPPDGASASSVAAAAPTPPSSPWAAAASASPSAGDASELWTLDGASSSDDSDVEQRFSEASQLRSGATLHGMLVRHGVVRPVRCASPAAWRGCGLARARLWVPRAWHLALCTLHCRPRLWTTTSWAC